MLSFPHQKAEKELLVCHIPPEMSSMGHTGIGIFIRNSAPKYCWVAGLGSTCVQIGQTVRMHGKPIPTLQANLSFHGCVTTEPLPVGVTKNLL